MSAEGWNHFKFEDICTKIGSGATPTGGANAYKNAGISLIRSQNVRDFSFSNEGLAFIDDEQAEKLKSVTVSSGDVLLNITGDSVARSCIVTDEVLPARVNQHVSIIRVNESLSNNKFVFYYTQHIKPYLLSLAGNGATRNALTKAMIEQLDILLPPLPEQRAIAATLAALDDKIELNNRINKTLEEMAQALFKRWFVDFEFPDENGLPYKFSGGEMEESELGLIPKGWKVGKLSDILSNTKSAAKAGESLRGLRYVPIETIPMKRFFLTESQSWESAQSSLINFNENDILFGAMRVYFHRVVIAPFDGITRTTCFVLRPKNSFDLAYSSMLLFQESTINFANAHSKGTTIPYAVWENSLDNMPIILPVETIRKNFFEAMMPISEHLKGSYFENGNLTSLRDALLPKLMSGEIRVPIEEVATDV